MVIDGRKIAEEITHELAQELAHEHLKLGIVANAGDPATESFVKIKMRVAEKLGVEVVRGKLRELLKTCDGVIVQLPHPNAEVLLAQLPPEKDVDALGPSPRVRAPVAEAVSEILVRSGVAASGGKLS